MSLSNIKVNSTNVLNISQTLGDNEDSIMSQKATSDIFLKIAPSKPDGEDVLVLSNSNLSDIALNSDAYVSLIDTSLVHSSYFVVSKVKYRSAGASSINIWLAAMDNGDTEPKLIRDFGPFSVATSGETIITINSSEVFHRTDHDKWYIGIKHSSNYYYSTYGPQSFRFRENEWSYVGSITFDADFYLSDIQLTSISEYLDNYQPLLQAKTDIIDLQINCTKIVFSDNKDINYFLPNIYTSVEGAVAIGIIKATSYNFIAIALYDSLAGGNEHEIARMNIYTVDAKDGIYTDNEGTFKVFLYHSSDLRNDFLYMGSTLSSIYSSELQFLINSKDIEDILSSMPYDIGNEKLFLSNTNTPYQITNSDCYVYKINVPEIFGFTTVKYRSVGANKIGVWLVGKNQSDEYPTIVRNYGDFEVTTSGETVITLENQTPLKRSQFDEWYIGIKHYDQLYAYTFKKGSELYGWRYRDGVWTPSIYPGGYGDPILYNADFYIGTPVPGNLNERLERIYEDLEDLDTRVSILENSEGGQIEAGIKYDYISLYRTTSFTDWLNWKAGSQQATDWTIDSNGATPTSHSTFESKARNGVLYLNKHYQSAWKKAVFDVVLYTDTVLDIHFARHQSTGSTPNESLYQIDCVNSVLNVMALSDRTITYNVFKSKNLDFTIVNGRKYRCEVSMEDVSFKFALTDMTTAETTILIFSNTWAAGTQKESYGFGWKAGSTAPTIKYFEVFEPRNPLVCFLGDSITEGYGMQSNFKNKFASVAVRSLLKNSIICAASSNTISNIRVAINDELSIIKPKYAIITIGTNDGEGVSSDSYLNLKTSLENIDCVPIFNHIPASNYAGHSPIVINGKIDAAGVFNGAYLDVATSVNNNPESGLNTSMFADGVHPNQNGTIAILMRFITDIQFLFNTDLISKYWENNN